ncbi:DUF362 domain-containing protein [Candidatus Woesearchaeota archaeon]|nr:DUF362 domain-containing protein [Candidatus Woesearchaeota archaeon]
MTDVYVVKQENYNKDEIKLKILQGLKEIDFDLNKVKNNAKILIKPNILSHHPPEKHVTTNPVIVDAVLDILTTNYKNKQFQIIIGESSGVQLRGGTKKAFETSGIKEVAEKYKVKCQDFESSKKIIIDTKGLKDEYHKKTLAFAEELINADLIINLSKMKTHVMMEYTGAIKNLFGLIAGSQKALFHAKAPTQQKFSEVLIDIYQYANTKTMLNIMDGIIGMEGNGPANGIPKKANLLIMSDDALALDIVATNIMGFDSIKLEFVKECLRRKMNPFPIQQKGIPKISIPFKKAFNIYGKAPTFIYKKAASLLVLNPTINHDKCKRCQVCLKHCPVHAITFANNKIHIDYNKCIHCFCCHELCPYDAISLERKIDFISKIFRKKEVKKVESKNNTK